MPHDPRDPDDRADALRTEHVRRRQLVAFSAWRRGFHSWKSPDFFTAREDGRTPLVSFAGRINRATYLGGLIGTWLTLLLLVLPLATFVGAAARSSDLGTALAFVLGVPLAVFGLSIQVRRLHDLDRSAWWLLAPAALAIVVRALFAEDTSDVAVSMIKFGWFALLAFAPGTTGSNRFGRQPAPGGAFFLGGRRSGGASTARN